ncbi:thioesterase II family protein [Streptomyces sp. NPDC060000]|uniref:thioesterase II family protein n=1 Tax=Streptomyces sp. NPDC060000 TaxID=3347031 RepID=UPI0036A0F95B
MPSSFPSTGGPDTRPHAGHTSASGWLTTWRTPGPARRRLLCLPPAGGAAHLYRHWAAGLPAGTEVVAVELPGHGTRMTERPVTRMAEVIDGIETALDPLPELPLVIFGHSMGAVVGWELARSLRHRRGHPVRGMISACSPAPTAPPPSRWGAGAETPDEELLALLDRSRSLPAELRAHPEFLRLYLPVLRADLEILARHRARREHPLPCALRVYLGSDDPLVGEAQAWPWAAEELCGDRLLRVFPGGHFFLHEHPGPVLDALTRDLDLMTPGA